MSEQPKNRIPVPENHVRKDAAITQLREGLNIINRPHASLRSENAAGKSTEKSERAVQKNSSEPTRKRRGEAVKSQANNKVQKKRPTEIKRGANMLTADKPIKRADENKVHPKYSAPHRSDAEKERRQRLKEEYRRKQELLNRQQRLKKIREKERNRQAKQKLEAEREQKQIARQKMLERQLEKQRESETKKRYSRELSVEQNTRKRLQGEKQKEYTEALFKAFLLRAVASVILGVLLFTVSFSIFLFTFHFKTHGSSELTVKIGATESKYAENEFTNGRTAYVCIDEIASMCGFTVIKTENGVKYISHGAGNESAVFTPGSATVRINGTEIRLKDVPFEKDGKIYIPLYFISDYCIGLTATYDKEANTASVTRNVLSESKDAVTYEDITFTVKSSEELEGIDESILGDG